MLVESDREFAEFYYLTPSGFEKLGGLWPIRAGHNIAKPDYRVGPKWIECCSLHFIVSGQVLLEWDNQEVCLQGGDLFCMYPNRVYQYRSVPHECPLKMKWLAFDGSQADHLLKFSGLHPSRPYLRQAADAIIMDALEELFGLFPKNKQRQPAGEMLRIQSMLYRLFSHLAAQGEPPPVNQSSAGHWIQDCVEYINMHYTEKLTVVSIADYIGVHRSHLSTEFAKRIGVSPIKYIQNLRMSQGAWMLKETERSVTEIALSLGYPDLYSFNRAFRLHTGASPTGYRHSAHASE